MKRSLQLSITAVLVLVFSCPAFANKDLFPREGLEDRVDFWKKVFAVYGREDRIIHDKFHVNLIYDVAPEFDASDRVRRVRGLLEEIRTTGNPETLSVEALTIYEQIQKRGLTITPELIGRLSNGIHVQTGIKERFREGIIRSGRYIERFEEGFEARSMPKELALLPLVESSFQNARSKAGATGVWQFTRGTGRLYMKVNSRVDERQDPYKSADAAARLLRDNYKALGTWPLALTAYNHGRAGMMRAQDRHGSDMLKIINEYDGPYFGYASMNFYAEFLAAVDVYHDRERHFGHLVLDRPEHVRVLQTVSADAPTMRAGRGTPDRYRVRSGDTLSEIAARFGTSIRAIMDVNNLKGSMIHAGQILMLR